jgi:hypothetical protein
MFLDVFTTSCIISVALSGLWRAQVGRVHHEYSNIGIICGEGGVCVATNLTQPVSIFLRKEVRHKPVAQKNYYLTEWRCLCVGEVGKGVQDWSQSEGLGVRTHWHLCSGRLYRYCPGFEVLCSDCKSSLLLLSLVGWDWVHLVLRPLLAYCTSPWW